MAEMAVKQEIKKEPIKYKRNDNKEEEKLEALVKERDEANAKKEALDKYIAKQEKSGELLQAAIDGNTKEVELQHAINEAVAIHGEHNRQQITDILTANQGLKDQKTEIDKNTEATEALKGKFAQIGQEIEDGIIPDPNMPIDPATGMPMDPNMDLGQPITEPDLDSQGVSTEVQMPKGGEI